MSSFQRFKRDVKSRSGSSDVRSSVFRGNQKKDTNIFNLMSFSSHSVIFIIDEKMPYSISKLKITNLTGYKIHYKIRCNNSKCYTVTPFEQVIQDKQTIQVKFQFHRSSNDLSANSSDKFQIIWGKIPYQPTQPSTLTQSKVFPVQFRQKDPQEDFLDAINDDDDYKATNKFRVANTQNQFTKQQKQNYEQDPQKALFNGSKQANLNPTLLTKYNLILISVISFILGFICT